MKKILVFCIVFSSSILSAAAGTAAASSDDSLARMAPYIELVKHAPIYLADPIYFNGSDRERDELLAHAQTICRQDNDRLSLFSGVLHTIHKEQLIFDDKLKSIRQHPQFDEDRITKTKACALKYLAAGSMADAVHRLAVDMNSLIVDRMLRASEQTQSQADIDKHEPFDVTLIRLIHLEKKSIKIAMLPSKNTYIQIALRQAAARGVTLEIVVDAAAPYSFFAAGLSFQKIACINASTSIPSCIMFEQNINDAPVVIYDACGVQPCSKLRDSYITRNKSTYAEYSHYFNQLVTQSHFDLARKLPFVIEKQKVQPSEKISSEARLLSRVVESIWWDHFCAPVKDESFEDAYKRQRRW